MASAECDCFETVSSFLSWSNQKPALEELFLSISATNSAFLSSSNSQFLVDLSLDIEIEDFGSRHGLGQAERLGVLLQQSFHRPVSVRMPLAVKPNCDKR